MADGSRRSAAAELRVRRRPGRPTCAWPASRARLRRRRFAAGLSRWVRRRGLAPPGCGLAGAAALAGARPWPAPWPPASAPAAAPRARRDRQQERLQRRQAFRLARLAVIQRADLVPSTNVAVSAQSYPFGRLAAQPHAQAQDRQAHAAAAAELAAFRPRAEPAAAQHRLIFDIVRPDQLLRRDRKAFDPVLAARLAHPFARLRGRHRRWSGCARRFRRCAVSVAWRRPAGVFCGGAAAARARGAARPPAAARAGAGSGAPAACGRQRRRWPSARRMICSFGASPLGVRRLVDRDQHLRRPARHAHQRGAVPAAQPAIVAERADGDGFRLEGRARRQRHAACRAAR